MQNYCSKCGLKIESESNFCPECGQKLDSAQATHVSVPATGSTRKKSKSTKSKKLALGIGVLSIALVAGIGIALHSTTKSAPISGQPCNNAGETSPDGKLTCSWHGSGVWEPVGSNDSLGTSQYISSQDASLLAENGATMVDTTALAKMSMVGEKPDFGSGDGTLKSYADALYQMMMPRAAGNFGSSPTTGIITEKFIAQQMQPGFGLNATIRNLFIGNDVQTAVFDEFLQDAANDEAAGKTFQDYRN